MVRLAAAAVAALLWDGPEYPLARLPLLLLVGCCRLPPAAETPCTAGLLSLAAFHFLIWSRALRDQVSDVRAPEMCLGAGYVLAHLGRVPGLRSGGPQLAAGLLVVGLALGTACQASVFGRPFLQTVGLESRETYLLRGAPTTRW